PGGSVPARAVGGRSGPTGPAVAFRPFVSDCERPGPRADRLLPDGVLPTLYRLVRSCRTVVLLACPARHFGKPVARGGLLLGESPVLLGLPLVDLRHAQVVRRIVLLVDVRYAAQVLVALLLLGQPAVLGVAQL